MYNSEIKPKLYHFYPGLYVWFNGGEQIEYGRVVNSGFLLGQIGSVDKDGYVTIRDLIFDRVEYEINYYYEPDSIQPILKPWTEVPPEELYNCIQPQFFDFAEIGDTTYFPPEFNLFEPIRKNKEMYVQISFINDDPYCHWISSIAATCVDSITLWDLYYQGYDTLDFIPNNYARIFNDFSDLVARDKKASNVEEIWKNYF